MLPIFITWKYVVLSSWGVPTAIDEDNKGKLVQLFSLFFWGG